MCDSLTMSKTRTNKKPASISSRRSERQNTKNCPLAEMSPYSPPPPLWWSCDYVQEEGWWWKQGWKSSLQISRSWLTLTLQITKLTTCRKRSSFRGSKTWCSNKHTSGVHQVMQVTRVHLRALDLLNLYRPQVQGLTDSEDACLW